jgi:hypothetical protein
VSAEEDGGMDPHKHSRCRTGQGLPREESDMDLIALEDTTPRLRRPRHRRLFVRQRHQLEDESFEGEDEDACAERPQFSCRNASCVLENDRARWDCSSDTPQEDARACSNGGTGPVRPAQGRSKLRRKRCKFLDDEADVEGDSEGDEEDHEAGWQDDGFIALTQVMSQHTPVTDERAMYLRSLRTPESSDAELLQRVLAMDAAYDQGSGGGSAGYDEMETDDVDEVSM